MCFRYHVHQRTDSVSAAQLSLGAARDVHKYVAAELQDEDVLRRRAMHQQLDHRADACWAS